LVISKVLKTRRVKRQAQDDREKKIINKEKKS